jgi:hypothetical protein
MPSPCGSTPLPWIAVDVGEMDTLLRETGINELSEEDLENGVIRYIGCDWLWRFRNGDRITRVVSQYGGREKIERWILRAYHGDQGNYDYKMKYITNVRQQIVDSSVHGLALSIVTMLLVYQGVECQDDTQTFYGRNYCTAFSGIFFFLVFSSAMLLLAFSYQCVFMFMSAPFETMINTHAQYRLLRRADLNMLSAKLRYAVVLVTLALPLGVAMQAPPLFAASAAIVTIYVCLAMTFWEKHMDLAATCELLFEVKRILRGDPSRPGSVASSVSTR